MKLIRHFIFISLLSCPLLQIGVQAELPKPSGGKEAPPPPLVISTFQSQQASNWYLQKPDGKLSILKYFRIQFRISDGSVEALDSAHVYLYDANKELVDKLDNFSQTEKSMVPSPNIVTSLKGLSANKSYNLVFSYEAAAVKWKYAIAVIRVGDHTVTDVLPSNTKVEDFDFKEKRSDSGGGGGRKKKTSD